MILGFGLSFSRTYISTEVLFPTAFVLLIVVLLIKPGGIFSAKKKRGA
jgi:branched-chain amino acid transport system permease protein